MSLRKINPMATAIRSSIRTGQILYENCCRELHHKKSKLDTPDEPHNPRKRQADPDAAQNSKIPNKESKNNPHDYALPLAVDREREIKAAVIGAFQRISEPDAASSMASSIYAWSPRTIRNEIYSLHLRDCGRICLDASSFSEWFVSKIEQYIAETNTSVHGSSGEADLDSASPAGKIVQWLKTKSTTSPGTALASAADAAHAAQTREDLQAPIRGLPVQVRSTAPLVGAVVSPVRPRAAGQLPPAAAMAANDRAGSVGIAEPGQSGGATARIVLNAAGACGGGDGCVGGGGGPGLRWRQQRRRR
jgi:hypothetical protein